MYTFLIIWTIIILSTFLQNDIEIFFFLLKKKKPQTLKGQKQKQKNDKLLYKKSAIQHLNINNNNSIFGCKSRSFLQCLNQDEGEKNTKTFLS